MATTPVGSYTRESTITSVRDMRQKMNEVLEQIREGSRSLSSVMQPVDESVLNHLYVVKVLESFSNVGKIRARQTLDDLKISHKQKMRELNNDERSALLGLLK